MSLKVIKLLCVVHGTILGIRMNGHDVIGHVSQAILEYMENHMSEFDEQMQELCSHDTRGTNDVIVAEE